VRIDLRRADGHRMCDGIGCLCHRTGGMG